MSGLAGTRRRRDILVVVVALVAFTAACGTGGLDFKDSTKLRDLRPRAYQSRTTPMKLSWRATPLPPGQKYLVLVDQVPMEPGQSIDDLVDDSCKATRGCPDKAYLDAHYMYETTDDHISIPAVPIAGMYDTDDLSDLHHVVIIVLDRANRRVGEQSWTTDVRVPT
jgi:hypothetical protein